MSIKNNSDREIHQRKTAAQMIEAKIKKRNPSWKGYHKRAVTQAQEANLNRFESETAWINIQDDRKRWEKGKKCNIQDDFKVRREAERDNSYSSLNKMVPPHNPYISQYHLGLIDEVPNEMPNIGTKELYDRYERARKKDRTKQRDEKLRSNKTREVEKEERESEIKIAKEIQELREENKELRERLRNLEEQENIRLQERSMKRLEESIKQDGDAELTSQEKIAKNDKKTDKGEVTSIDQEPATYDSLDQRARKEPSFFEKIRGLERGSFSSTSLKNGLRNVSTDIPAGKESGKELGYFLLLWAIWMLGGVTYLYLGLNWHSLIIAKSFFLIPFRRVSKG